MKQKYTLSDPILTNCCRDKIDAECSILLNRQLEAIGYEETTALRKLLHFDMDY